MCRVEFKWLSVCVDGLVACTVLSEVWKLICCALFSFRMESFGGRGVICVVCHVSPFPALFSFFSDTNSLTIWKCKYCVGWEKWWSTLGWSHNYQGRQFRADQYLRPTWPLLFLVTSSAWLTGRAGDEMTNCQSPSNLYHTSPVTLSNSLLIMIYTFTIWLAALHRLNTNDNSLSLGQHNVLL